MIKEWATVVSYHNGKVILRYSSNISCSNCIVRSTCCSFMLKNIVQKTDYQLELKVIHPLVVGQKVQLGISTGSLLRLAMIVYLTPLLGFFIGGMVMQFFLNQFIVFLGAIIFSFIGFFLAKKIVCVLEKKTLYQPTILQIGLPPDELKEQK